MWDTGTLAAFTNVRDIGILDTARVLNIGTSFVCTNVWDMNILDH